LGVEGESNFEPANDSVEVSKRDGVRADIAKRIRRACTHLSEDEFGQLVDAMTDRQLRGERRLNRDFWKE
jgi:hypothetical protein